MGTFLKILDIKKRKSHTFDSRKIWQILTIDCSQCQFSKVMKEKIENYIRGKGPKMGAFKRVKIINDNIN